MTGAIRAVDDVDLTVRSGETVGLVGESGSGKSTLGRLALRLIEPTSGRVVLAGEDITDLPAGKLRAQRKHGQMIFQDPYSSLDPRASIAENVGEPLKTHFGMSKAKRDDRVAELLEQVSLKREHLNRFPHEFSGGQLQRIALARALAVRPGLIVADEPVSSLDVSTQAQILRLLGDLQDEFHVAYLFISHDLSVVRHISSRIAVMYLGQIVEIGSNDEVATRPTHPYTAALLSAVPIPAPRIQRSRRRIVLSGDLPSPSSVAVGCRFSTRCPYVMDICRSVDARTVRDTGGYGGALPPARARPGVARRASARPPDPRVRPPDGRCQLAGVARSRGVEAAIAVCQDVDVVQIGDRPQRVEQLVAGGDAEQWLRLAPELAAPARRRWPGRPGWPFGNELRIRRRAPLVNEMSISWAGSSFHRAVIAGSGATVIFAISGRSAGSSTRAGS